MSTPPTPNAVCRTCVDYAEDHAVLVLVDGEHVHECNGSARCPGQEDDDTDDVAEPMSFTDFLDEFDDEVVARVLAEYLQDRADR